DYIRNKGCITSLEAYQNLKVTQLAARITDLEGRGFVFAKPRMKAGGRGKPVTHYSIVENGVEVWAQDQWEWKDGK
ncbi:helix-turn-helix domain-containing protein, partial [Neisseria gonorrhoeae]